MSVFCEHGALQAAGRSALGSVDTFMAALEQADLALGLSLRSFGHDRRQPVTG
jgi:hypothetical protein